MRVQGIEWFQQEYLRAALIISLLGVWVLVGLSNNKNRYVQRESFTIWTAVWLFCALLVTLGLRVQMPALLILAVGGVFAGTCAFRFRKKLPCLAAGMMSLGCFGWSVSLGIHPLLQETSQLRDLEALCVVVFQLIIGFGMLALVREETKHHTESLQTRIEAGHSEKKELESKLAATEERCRILAEKVRAAEPTQQAFDELRRTQEAVVQHERLRAVEKMASGIAHEINNALCPILCYADLLQTSETNLSPAARQQLQNISKAAENISKIVARARQAYRIDNAESAPPKRIAEPAEDRPLRVLCIDDEPSMGQLMRHCLKRFNHNVMTADGGRQGVEIFRSAAADKKPYDVVITDLGMPEMDGHQVARAIKAESPGTPIIMLTGWGNMIEENREKAPEVDAVVAKPPHLQELNRLLLQMTANHGKDCAATVVAAE